MFCILFSISLYAEIFPPKPRTIEFDLKQNDTSFLSAQIHHQMILSEKSDYFTRMEKLRTLLQRYDALWRSYAELLTQAEKVGEAEGTVVEFALGEFIKTKWYILNQMKKVYRLLKNLQNEITFHEPLDIDLEFKETFEKNLRSKQISSDFDLKLIVTQYGYDLCTIAGDEYARLAYKNPVPNPSLEERTERAQNLMHAVYLWKLAITYAPTLGERSDKERLELLQDLAMAYAYLGFKKELEDLCKDKNFEFQLVLDPLIQMNVTPTQRNNPYQMSWAKEVLIREKGIWDVDQRKYIVPFYDIQRGKIIVQSDELYAEMDSQLRFEYVRDLKRKR